MKIFLSLLLVSISATYALEAVSAPKPLITVAPNSKGGAELLVNGGRASALSDQQLYLAATQSGYSGTAEKHKFMSWFCRTFGGSYQYYCANCSYACSKTQSVE